MLAYRGGNGRNKLAVFVAFQFSFDHPSKLQPPTTLAYVIHLRSSAVKIYLPSLR
jgi:hypothetical protein